MEPVGVRICRRKTTIKLPLKSHDQTTCPMQELPYNARYLTRTNLRNEEDFRPFHEPPIQLP